jgi:hypothetical protein
MCHLTHLWLVFQHELSVGSVSAGAVFHLTITKRPVAIVEGDSEKKKIEFIA